MASCGVLIGNECRLYKIFSNVLSQGYLYQPLKCVLHSFVFHFNRQRKLPLPSGFCASSVTSPTGESASCQRRRRCCGVFVQPWTTDFWCRYMHWPCFMCDLLDYHWRVLSIIFSKCSPYVFFCLYNALSIQMLFLFRVMTTQGTQPIETTTSVLMVLLSLLMLQLDLVTIAHDFSENGSPQLQALEAVKRDLGTQGRSLVSVSCLKDSRMQERLSGIAANEILAWTFGRAWGREARSWYIRNICFNWFLFNRLQHGRPGADQNSVSHRGKRESCINFWVRARPWNDILVHSYQQRVLTWRLNFLYAAFNLSFFFFTGS